MMNLKFSGKASFSSITAKRVERRLDGVWSTKDTTPPLLAVEFHLYPADEDLYSVVAEKMLALERLYPKRRNEGVLFFEGKAEFACKVLKRRFGELPESVEDKIMHLNYLKLEELSELVLDFAGLKALEKWLYR